MTRLRWFPGDRLSPIHAARCFAMGSPAVDESICVAIATPMSEFIGRLAGVEIDPSTFWTRLVSVSAAGDTDIVACREGLTAAGCSSLSIDVTASSLVTHLAEIRRAYQQRYPKLAEQLTLRGRPIREQWDGYSAGLLKRIGKQTHASFLPKTVSAMLLSPYRGGDGGLDASAGRVWIEAVLANPFPEIPEVLRLVWFVAQVGLIDAFSTGSADSHGDPWVPPARLPRVAALAMLPIVLEAGHYLEMISTPPGELPLLFPKTASAWRLSVDDQTLDALENWWMQFLDLQTPPPVALKALDRMLFATSDEPASGKSGMRR